MVDDNVRESWQEVISPLEVCGVINYAGMFGLN